ncbi:protein obstructor-E-like [Centruroides vittatus]|uniref:protein obstructor-E-like n=1 Tax=Centruroides sculpturatus TaxID=218467 RepID=UPI000C6D8428|nr:protein obstructor-E-like [Centruroides sculpturatus]XP_023221197.1 protein obstructor-E-like [Centruroides sculpturatus]
MDGTWLHTVIIATVLQIICSNRVHHHKGCLSERGQFPHEEYCDKYYDCWNGIAHTRQCSDDLLFNPVTLVCDWPRNVFCGGRRLRHIGSQLCPRQFGTFLDPYDCFSFIECVFGKPVRKQCAPGTAFNPTISVCDHLDRVKCYGRDVVTVAPPTPQDELAFRCPSVRGLFPFSRNCAKFWLCRNSIPVLLDCPVNQLFDIVKKSCLDKEQATCLVA